MALGLSILLSSAASQAWAQDGGVSQIYSCPQGQASAVAERLRAEFAVTGGVRVAAVERTSQVIVYAPPEIQAKIGQRLAASAPVKLASAPASVPTPSLSLAAGARQAELSLVSASPGKTRTITLRRAKPEQIEGALSNMMGSRLSALAASRPQTKCYRLAASNGGSIDVTFDLASSQVAVEGSGAAADNCIRLIQVLDGPQESNGRDVRFLPVRTAQFASVQRAAEAIQSTSSAQRTGQSLAASLAQPREQAAAGTTASAAAPMQVAAAAGAAPGPALPPSEGPNQPPEEKPRSGIVNPVQIEPLEGLDVVVIRGSPEDVEQVQKMIQQIEELARQTEPEIEIVTLKYVDCYALSTVVRSLYDEVYLARQGAVSITPMVKPNAILVVGRKENVKTVVELVEKLDQPIDPTAQFQFFHLKYASAVAVQQTLGDLFQDRGGFAPAVRVTADTRSNALVVQAGPRDMAEVAAIIKRIDTAGDTKEGPINEMKIVQLQHSMATDVANTLMQAIGAAMGQVQMGAPGMPQAGMGGAPGQFGQQRPGMMQGARPGGSQRPAMVRFLAGQKLITSGILSDVQITADARSNSVIVSAPAESMDLLLTLVKQLDELPAAEAQIKVFTIVNGDATTLLSTLQMLFQSQMMGGGQMQAMSMQMQGSGTGTSTVPLRFAVDTRTNSIISSGSASDLIVVEAVLTRLDDEVRNRKNFVFRLKNTPAALVAQTITTFLTSEQQIQMTFGGTSAFEQIEREVVVVPDTTTNSLVLSATPRFFDEIKSIIEQLDARPPMVMIQVLIAEVDLGCTNEFGMELGLQDSVLFDRSLLGGIQTLSTTTTTTTATVQNQTVVAATNTPGYNFNSTDPLGNSGAANSLATATNVAGQGLTNFALGRQNPNLGYGGLVLSLASENVSMLLRALAENHRVEVLQRPQIMTMDNQMAYIQVGQRVPTITAVTLNATGTTNSVTPQNVGLILQVQPRITPDGLVVMQIDAEKSVLEPIDNGIPITSVNNQVIRSPIIDTTIAQTTVSALSGHTVVLGGLIDNNHNEQHRKVPLLGDLPLLGHLFRFDSTVNSKTELLIIMTPHIVRNEADADAVKRAEAARMSWCLADVTRFHGEAGLRKRTDAWTDGETQVVFPDMKRQPGANPAVPEPIPTPAGQSAPSPANAPVLAPPSRGTVPLAPTPDSIRPIGPRTSDSLPGDPNADARPRPVQQQAQGPSFASPAAAGVQPVVYQQPVSGQQ